MLNKLIKMLNMYILLVVVIYISFKVVNPYIKTDYSNLHKLQQKRYDALLDVNSTEKTEITEYKVLGAIIPTGDPTWTIIDKSMVGTGKLNEYLGILMSAGKTKFYIKDGSYDLNDCIYINQANIIIEGQSKENTIFHQTNNSAKSIEVHASGVQVSDITIDNGEKGREVFFCDNSNNVVIKNCIINSSVNSVAIDFQGNVLTKSAGNHIEGNTINSNLGDTAPGIRFKFQDQGYIQGNDITGCRIEASLCSNTHVNSNIIQNTKTSGILWFVPGDNNEIASNIITDVIYSGIVIKCDGSADKDTYRANNFNIINNKITDSRYFGIEVNNLKSSMIEKNTITRTDYSGIYLLLSDNLIIKENTISDCNYVKINGVNPLVTWNTNSSSGIIAEDSVTYSYFDSNIITNDKVIAPYGIRINWGDNNNHNSIANNNITGYFEYSNSVRTGDPVYNTIDGYSTSLTKIPTPKNVKAVTSPGSITITWDDVIGVDGYEVEVDGTLIDNGTTAKYKKMGLASLETHKFRVRIKTGDWSAEITATTPDADPPSVPTGLNTSDVEETSLKLNWAASTDNVGVVEYDVYNGTTKVTTTTAISCNITGLNPSTTYNFKVTAKDAAGNESGASLPKLVKTLTPTDAQAPTVPTALNVSGISATSLKLNWTASTDNVGVTEYEIYRDDILITTTAIISCNITGLNPSTTYNFKVTAKDAAGNKSGASDILKVTTLTISPQPPILDVQPPTEPEGLNAVTVTSANIILAWMTSTDNVGVIEYEIYENDIKITTTAAISCNIIGLNSGTTYSFKVIAKDAAGNKSGASNVLNVTTSTITVPPPPVVSVPSNNNNLLRLSLSSGNLNPEFKSNLMNYYVSVNSEISSIKLIPTVEDAKATIKINDIPVTSGTTSSAININAGDNIINIKVTSESGLVKSYTIKISRASSAKRDYSDGEYKDYSSHDSNEHEEIHIKVKEVKIDSVSRKLNNGESVKLTAEIKPLDATNKALIWTSSNTAVAIVNKNGSVTAVGPGTAVITVSTVDGNYIASSTITVPYAAAKEAPIITFVGIEHSPLIEGDTENFYLTSVQADKVQYRMFLYSEESGIAQEITNGYTESVAANMPYKLSLDLKFNLGVYKLITWVKAEGSSNEYDSMYTANLNCVNKDDENRVYVNNDMDVEKDSYKLGDIVKINGIKNVQGIDGPYKYRLHIYNATTNTWVKNVTEYEDEIKWKPTEKGVYVLDVYVNTPNSNTWNKYLNDPNSEEVYGTYEAWKLKVIEVK